MTENAHEGLSPQNYYHKLFSWGMEISIWVSGSFLRQGTVFIRCLGMQNNHKPNFFWPGKHFYSCFLLWGWLKPYGWIWSQIFWDSPVTCLHLDSCRSNQLHSDFRKFKTAIKSSKAQPELPLFFLPSFKRAVISVHQSLMGLIHKGCPAYLPEGFSRTEVRKRISADHLQSKKFILC